MDDSPEDEIIENWSHASSSVHNSLFREETDSYDRIENESIEVDLVDNNYEEEDIWYSAHSSLEHLDEQSTSCDRCEEDAAARACLLLEMNEPKKELEHVYIAMKKKQDRDAAARTRWQLEMNETKKKLEHVYIAMKKKQDRDAAARTRLQLELDEIKKELERVYKISVHYKIRYEILKMNEEEAIEWFEEIEKELRNKQYECITENTVKKIIGIMKKFENNTVERGTNILKIMTGYSEMTVHYITNTTGGIECLMEVFEKSIRYYIPFLFQFQVFCDRFHILFRIAECKETQKKLMKSEYLSLIFERLSNEQDHHYISYYSIILSHLLDLSEDSFPVNITKNMIESKIIERLPLLSIDYIPSYMLPHDYSWYSDRLINGTKAQKYVCTIVVYYARDYSDLKKQFKDAGAIRFLVLSDA